MTLHLVPSTTEQHNSGNSTSTEDTEVPTHDDARLHARTFTVTDATSGLTVRFDGLAGGALLFDIDACCCHDSDEFRGAAMLQLAVAGDTPIHWLVAHDSCAERIEQVLGDTAGQIVVCRPPAAA